ncbi:MAG: Spy/CpxP family protein refolding chaperone [Chlamydiota bacterium]
MRARCIGAVTVLGMALLLLTLTGACAQPASTPGSDEAMMPPPRDGDGATMSSPPPPPGDEGGGRKGKGLGKHLKELDLTPEQQQKMKAQRKEQGIAMKSIRDALKAKHEELRAEIDKEKSDKAKIESITAELKKLEAQRIDQDVKGILQMKESLTPEQFKKLSAMREAGKGERRGGKGKGKGQRRGRGDDGEDTEAPCATPQALTTPAAAPTTAGAK